jgi:hypothetical protein
MYMIKRTVPFTFCLLLLISGLPLLGSLQTETTAQASHPFGEPTRAEIEWTRVLDGEYSTYLDSTGELTISFDDRNTSFSYSEPYDPYFSHNTTVRSAIDSAPQWLNESLSWKFLDLWNYTGERYARLLLNDSVDWRYMDEIAYTIAYLPSGVLNSYWVWSELIIENVEMIYKVAGEVSYAKLIERNRSDGQHTHIQYSFPIGNISLPEHMYYQYIVLPRNHFEQPNYVNMTTDQYTYPGDGIFWRSYLYEEADPGYAPLKFYLGNETTFWNYTRNQFENNGAVGAVTQWIMESMVFGRPDKRSTQPATIYKQHIGMCGEHSYLLTAAAKTALIPVVTVVNYDWMHAWNMFYMQGWHVWRGYDSIIDDTYAEGGPGAVNIHAAVNPDSTMFNPARIHTSTANLTVRVTDQHGKPVDGAMVKLFSQPVTNYEYALGLIGNVTDTNGESDFEIGTGFPYFVQVLTPIGKFLDDTAEIPLAVPMTSPGAMYYFNVSLNTSKPLKANLTKMDEHKWGTRFNITAENLFQWTSYHVDPLGFQRDQVREYEEGARVSVYFLDDENLSFYRSGLEFFPTGVINITRGSESSVILPEGSNYTLLICGLDTPKTRTRISFDVVVYRSVVTPKAVISSPAPGEYFVGKSLHFIGELDPYPSYIGDVHFFWYLNGSSEPFRTEKEFHAVLGLGGYKITLVIANESGGIDTDEVIIEIVMPNRAPSAVISSPGEEENFIAGTDIAFDSTGTIDPDNDPLTFTWTRASNGEVLSQMRSFNRKFIVGEHRVVLNVSDPEGLWSTAVVNFSVSSANHPPAVYIQSPAGYSSHFVDEEIFLSANGTFDLDQDELYYRWFSSLDGEISLHYQDNVTLSIGEHMITLFVTDGKDTTNRSTIIYVASRPPPPVNQPPVANISSPSSGEKYYVRQPIIFNSEGSHDPEGEALVYSWSLDGDVISRSSKFSTILPEGVHTLILSVWDGEVNGSTSVMFLVVNRPPVVQVTLNGTIVSWDDLVTVVENDTLVFDASGSNDPDGGELSYAWTVDEALNLTTDRISITFDSGYHEIYLVVSDEEGRTSKWTGSFSCIERPEPPKPPESDDDSEGRLRLTEPLIFIPLMMIIFLLIAAAVFFILSRRVDDFSLIEE